jgi:hypothetical protein
LGLIPRVVVDDEMQADQFESERTNAFDDPVERSRVDELSVEQCHPALGSELELGKCGAQHRARFAADLELEGLAHDRHLSAGSAHVLSREVWMSHTRRRRPLLGRNSVTAGYAPICRLVSTARYDWVG